MSKPPGSPLPPERRPVAGDGNIIVCYDGTAWQLMVTRDQNGRRYRWSQLPPIPGTPADR